MAGAGRVARVAAQAKVNLGLRVMAREASGFHQLETVFCRLALADDVTVRALDSATRTLDTAGADLGPVERNLAWRAAVAYQEAAGWPAGFEIAIDKHIPVGGGLGGGSADAGAVLRALDALNPHPIGEPALLALAMPLGSDVPFLTTTTPVVLAWGRGERMLALPPLERRRVLLAASTEGVPTPEAYRWLADARIGHWCPEPAVTEASASHAWESYAAQAVNDFEPVVFARAPHVAAAHRALSAAPGATMVMLSGSGATVFRVDDGTAPVEEIRAAVEAVPGARLVVTATAHSVAPVERAE